MSIGKAVGIFALVVVCLGVLTTSFSSSSQSGGTIPIAATPSHGGKRTRHRRHRKRGTRRH